MIFKNKLTNKKIKMSFNNQVIFTINKIIEEYITKVSLEFKIDKLHLKSLWECQTNVINQTTLCENKSVDENICSEKLNKLSKDKLSMLCKEKNLPYSGTKILLIKRLLEQNSGENTQKNKVSSVKEEPNILKKIISDIPIVAIRRNQFNNLEHLETLFVFDAKSKKVIGKQKEDGSIQDLVLEDIDLCNKYKFNYILPQNLNNKNTKEVNIEELEELSEEEEEKEEDVVDLENEIVLCDDDIECEEDYYEDEDD